MGFYNKMGGLLIIELLVKNTNNGKNIDKAITNNSFKVLLPEGFSSWSKDVITGSIGNRIGSQGSTSFAVDWGKSSFGTNFGGNFIGNIVGSLLNASIK